MAIKSQALVLEYTNQNITDNHVDEILDQTLDAGELNLSNNKLTEEGIVKLLLALAHNKTITKLDISKQTNGIEQVKLGAKCAGALRYFLRVNKVIKEFQFGPFINTSIVADDTCWDAIKDGLALNLTVETLNVIDASHSLPKHFVPLCSRMPVQDSCKALLQAYAAHKKKLEGSGEDDIDTGGSISPMPRTRRRTVSISN